MRIVFVGRSLQGMGGASITSWQIVRQLARAGDRIRAVIPTTPAASALAEAFERKTPEIPTRHYMLPDFYSDASLLREPTTWEHSRRQITDLVHELAREEPIDVILVGREVECLAVPDLAARLRIPWVMRCGGLTLHFLHEGALAPALDGALRNALPSAAATIVQADHMVPIAEAVGCRNITVIPSPVDLSMFSPRARPADWCEHLKIAPTAPVILLACNMKKDKRTEDVVDSAAIVLRSHPDAVYVIAGDGLRWSDLVDRCQRLGLADNFRFLGRIDYERMPELFALSTAVVAPSAFEQQSRVYLETQASGRVLIASDIAGARDVVEDGVTGLLFPLGNTQALAAATMRVLSDPSLRAAIGARARQRVSTHSLDGIAGRFSALLENLVDT